MATRDTDLHRQGNRLLAQRDFDGARAAFEELIAQSPSNPDGYIGLAKVLERTNAYEEIVTRLAPVVDRLDSAQLLRLLADAYRVLANRGQTHLTRWAIEYYDRYHAKRMDPVTLFYQAELLMKTGDLVAAARAFRASWDRDPRSRDAFRGLLACLEKLGRVDEMAAARRLWATRTNQVSGAG